VEVAVSRRTSDGTANTTCSRNAGIWGLNHCFVALLKVAAVLAKDKEQLKKLWVLTAATTAYVAKWNNDVADYGGDLGGFVVVCGLQTLSIGYLAFA
jgi:hypothetical protein